MPIFKKLNIDNETPLHTLRTSIEQLVNTSTIVPPAAVKTLFGSTQISESVRDTLSKSMDNLQTSVESIATDLNMVHVNKVQKDDRRIAFTTAQSDAAVAAGLMGGDVKAFLNNKVEPLVSTESLTVSSYTVPDAVSGRSPSTEAFDERESRLVQSYSMVYNFIAAQQDEFGETFFPTVVVTPDNPGFIMEVPLMMVYDDFVRDISGKLDNYNKKNVIRAFSDHTILKNDMTRIVPVHRPESAKFFVDSATIAPYDIDRDGAIIKTAPLKVGEEFSLLAISQDDAMLAGGANDPSDSIDTSVTLMAAYVKVGDDIFKFNVSALPSAVFTYSVQHNYRRMSLDFVTSSILLNKDTKTIDGNTPTTLGVINSSDLMVRLSMKMNGSVNIELGDTSVYGTSVGVSIVRDSAGNKLALESSPAADIVTAFKTAEIIGYDIQAYRTNINRRQRGQLIDTTIQRQAYNVPLRSPITALRPINTDGTDDADLRTLITATRARTSNSAVTALLNAVDVLKNYIDVRDDQGVPPDVLGISRFLVTPVYFEEHINVADHIDSLRSFERKEDTQAVLVNKIRDYAYRMYRDSLYKAAADALAGGQAPIPTVIIGTDPVISRYLTVTGDLRTLGNDFDVRIVSTLDKRMTGRVIITFGDMSDARNSEPSRLGFGNMIWSPELTIAAQMTRNGAVVRELAVSPRFIHIPNLPIVCSLTVEGIEDVMTAVPIKFKDIS